MSTTPTTDIAAEFARALERRESAALAELYHDDAVLDCNVPQWRFVLEGRTAVREHLAGELDAVDEVTEVSVRTFDPTRWTAFEVEVQLTRDGQRRLYREVELVRTVDGRIAEHVAYCTGEWDEETIRRHGGTARH